MSRLNSILEKYRKFTLVYDAKVKGYKARPDQMHNSIEAKQQIKDLFKELIGKDERIYSKNISHLSDSEIERRKERNHVRNELRQKVDEL